MRQEAGLYRAKDKIADKWLTGNLITYDKTVYCFKEDYEADPEIRVYQIGIARMTDWGLPTVYEIRDVLPETICEYSGVKTKDGKFIYEKDIVKTHYKEYRNDTKWERDYKITDERDIYGVVKFFKGAYIVEWVDYIPYNAQLYNALVGDLIYGKVPYENNEGWYWKYDLDAIEVVGNVYDNPDLIKREVEE